MSPTYATATTVSTAKSREEIETVLARYGASDFAYATNPQRAMVGFIAAGRTVRFMVPLPPKDAAQFRFTPEKNLARTPAKALEAWEQACRQRWRALALVIKAKLEAVEAGIVTFEQEFAMHMVLPDGTTVADQVIPAIALAYETGETPALIQGPA